METISLFIQNFGPWACLVGVTAWFMYNEGENRKERQETNQNHMEEVDKLREAYEMNTKVLTELATLLREGADGK